MAETSVGEGTHPCNFIDVYFTALVLWAAHDGFGESKERRDERFRD
jgi:hypothetical protein